LALTAPQGRLVRDGTATIDNVWACPKFLDYQTLIETFADGEAVIPRKTNENETTLRRTYTRPAFAR
jgi:hypothetical protein